VTKYPVRQVKFKEQGRSTLSAPKIWYDEQVGRLNTDGYGRLLGSFNTEDRIIVFYKDGYYELTDFDLSNRYETESILAIEKWVPQDPITAVYFDNDKKQFNIKRFRVETQTLKNKFLFIKEGNKNYLEFVTTHPEPTLTILTGKKKSEAISTEWKPAEQVEVTGWKTIGVKLSDKDLLQIEASYPTAVTDTEVNEQQEDEGEANAAPTLF